MDSTSKNFVHLPIDAVDTVVYDPQGHYDGEHYDRYATFTEARDAALSSIEIMLDEADYDGDDHREELERMQGLLDAAETYEDLASQPAHHRLLDRQGKARPVAA